jgi:CBS domain-containing protein
MRVAEVMTAPPLTTTTDAGVDDALALLGHHHVTSLPVVDATGRLQGLLHEVDVIRGRVPHQAPGAPSHSTPPSVVADVMAPVPARLGPDTDLATAADLLGSSSVTSLPVVDGRGHVVGMLSRSDVVGVLTAAHDRDDGLDPLGRRLLQLACRAPSVHNTQPWLWRVDGPVVELYADPARQLRVSDPDGRNLRISCGAALHHLQVAARGLGQACAVERLPAGPGSTLLARVTLEPRPLEPDGEAEARADLEAITARVTDRRRFTSWEVPAPRLEHLAAVGAREGCAVVPVVDEGRRHRLEELVEQARALLSQDPEVRAEQQSWVQRSAHDGVPVPATEGPATRFDDRPVVDPGGIDRADGVLVLATPTDEPIDHLRAGAALSRAWLTATTGLLSMVPLSHVVERPETRRALQDDVLGSALVPQLLVRVGWQESSRERLAPSPRRPLADVLVR